MDGVDIDPALLTDREMRERLADRGVLAKDTHGWSVRPAPPLTVTVEFNSAGHLTSSRRCCTMSAD